MKPIVIKLLALTMIVVMTAGMWCISYAESDDVTVLINNTVARIEYEIPEQYTKVKFFCGTYGFGSVDVIAAMTDDERAFYIQYICFDEDQILEGTVDNGVCTVTFDKSGFMSGDCQSIYDDALASSEVWKQLTNDEPVDEMNGIARAEYEIPAQYTKVKFFTGTFGFGDADVIAAMTDDENAFYIQYVCFDEDQILEGTVDNGVCIVTFDRSGFMSGDCQSIYDNALASNEAWQTLTDEILLVNTGAQSSVNRPKGSLLDLNEHIWQIPENASPQELMTLLRRNMVIVGMMRSLFTPESYQTFRDAAAEARQKKSRMTVADVQGTIDCLVQTSSVSDNVWYIWKDNMPMVDGEVFTEAELDGGNRGYVYGLKPMLVKCLVDDPTKAKGNIIVIFRSVNADDAEGYPAADAFREQGYNVFLLYARNRPYSSEDTAMDLQRAVRYVRHYAEIEGWGGSDMIATASWGGGGVSVMIAYDNLYGAITPQIYDTDYSPDEIDTVSSDPDVNIMVYSAFNKEEMGLVQVSPENMNLPAFFIFTGDSDAMGRTVDCIALYEEMKDKTSSELIVIEGAGHGFGIGQEGAPCSTPECASVITEADRFMQTHVGYSSRNK